MNDEIRKSKDRSPNFPFIPLADAVNRAQQFYDNEKRGVAPFAAVAAHWHYSPSSSGALQTAGALKSYGLMVDEGAGAQRSMRLTDLGLRILLDRRPDSSERSELLRRAALGPGVAVDIYAKWPDGLPSRPTLHHYLVLDRGFGDQKANSVINILFKNEEFTGVPSVSSESPNSQNAAESEEDESSTANVPRSTPSILPSMPVSNRAERLSFPGAEILINFQGDPNYETFEFIEKYMVLRKSLLKKNELNVGQKTAETNSSDGTL